jgi:hypothetical protein
MLMFTLGSTNQLGPSPSGLLPAQEPPQTYPPPPAIKKLLSAWGSQIITPSTVTATPTVPDIETRPPPLTVPPPLSPTPSPTEPYQPPPIDTSSTPEGDGQPYQPPPINTTPSSPGTQTAPPLSPPTPMPPPPNGVVYPGAPPQQSIPTPPDGMLPVEAVKRVPKWAWWAGGVTLAGGLIGLILSAR